MKLSDEALQVAAECISRGEHITVEMRSNEAQGDVWCEQCRTDSAVTIPLQGITDKGVYDLGTVTACVLHDGETS